MGQVAELGRRLRRQRGPRLLAWTAICFFFFFFALPEVRRRWADAGASPFTTHLVTGGSQCALVPPSELSRLREEQDMSIHTYQSGHVLGGTNAISSPGSVCVLVAVSQSGPENGVYKDVPVPGEGPDLMHLYLNSTSVGITNPPLKPLPGQPEAEAQQAKGTLLYYAEVSLRDSGSYEISAEREYKNWRWAKQWYHNGTTDSVHFPTGHIEPIFNATDDVAKIMEVNRVIHDGKPLDPKPVALSKMFPQKIIVAGGGGQDDVQAARKVSCSSLPGFDAGVGRWYRQADFPHLPAAAADEWGFVYDLDECTLEYFDELDVTDCLAGKTIQVFGDSNSRRLSRAIMSAGRWCHDATDRCQKEDWGDDVLKVVVNASTGALDEEMETPEHNGQFELNDRRPFHWGRDATLYFNFMQSIVMAPKDWLANFYAPADFTVGPEGTLVPFDAAQQLRQGAAARRPVDMPEPDLVVVGIGAWDEAFDWTYADFARTVPHFRDALLAAYPDPSRTRLALRLSQGHCCRRNWTEDLRRFSGGRIARFRDIMLRAWDVRRGHGMRGRVAIVDASGMSGRPEVVNDYGGVGSNHQRAAHTRVEMQILLNHVCHRDASGKALWKGGSPRSSDVV